RGQRSAPRPTRDVFGVEEPRRLVPERARLQRLAVVRRRLADERQTTAGPGAGRVEEIAGASDRVGALEPRTQRGAPLVVQERRRAPAARQAALLETEDEDGVERARARMRQVDHRDPPRLARADRARSRSLERRDDVLLVERTVDGLEGDQLLEHLRGGL